MSSKIYKEKIEKLRSSPRLRLLEVDRVVKLSLESLQAASVLDVGTGSGVFAEAFMKQGLQATGIDINPEMIAAVKTILPGAAFQVARAEELPFAGETFDLVFMGHVLHETDRPVTALKEALRVARKRVIILEWPFIEEEIGPPLDHRIPPETMRTYLQEAAADHTEYQKLKHMEFYLIHKL